MDIETCSAPTTGCEIDSLQDEVRRLKATIALQTQKMKRHAGKLKEIDEMTSIDDKIRALHEFREESKRWRTNNATGMDFKSAPLKQQFEGCTRAEQETMLRDLIESLAGDDDSAQVQPQSLAHVLHRYLLARGSIHTLVHDHFKDDMVPCNMLDELASAILRYPERFTKKWRLEFVRMSDFIRHLNQAPGQHRSQGFRFSRLNKQFCASLRFHCSESIYDFIVAHGGSDPDSQGLVNLLGVSDSQVMREIRNAAGSSKAGYVDSALGELKTRMRQAYHKGPDDPLPPVQLQLDFTDLLPRESSGKAICGKGEARMGDLSDGPDLASRLLWAADIDK